MRRYPVLLTTLMVSLALMGFLLAATGSKVLAWAYVGLYLAAILGWAVVCARSGENR